MRALRLGMALVLAAAATLGSGCLDNGGGPQDQWMNTDAYVGPEVSTATGDGGVTCGDAPVFAAPSRLSDDRERDGGAMHVQLEVAMAGDGAGARYVAWNDRSLAAPGQADLRAVAVSAAGSPGTIVNLVRPAGCDLLVEPALAVTAAGTVILAATCKSGSETTPTETQIVVFRSLDGLDSFEDPIVAASCFANTSQCEQPAVAATTAGTVYVAWTEWALDLGTVTGVQARVRVSDDDGVTLTGDAPVPATFAASTMPHLAVDPDDGVHLAFTGAFTLTGSTYTGYAKLGTSGTFATPEVLGPGTDPRLAVSSDGVYVVWIAGGDLLEEAHDTGAGFGPALPVAQATGTTAVLSPSVATSPDGFVHLFWLAESASGWTANYNVSKDKGVTWQGRVLVSGPFDGDPTGQAAPVHRIGGVDLCADADGVTLGWGDPASNDQMTGVTNVYLARRLCP